MLPKKKKKEGGGVGASERRSEKTKMERDEEKGVV